MIRLIVTFFWSGLLRPAPGTWGSVAGLIAGWLIAGTAGVTGLAVACVAVFALGLWATGVYAAQTGLHDPGEVVIDEVVGQWLALLPVFAVTTTLTGPGLVFSAIAFGLFRLFDIWKPGLVGWADRQDGALGVMLDDVIAGLMAAIIMAALLYGVG